jgi:hypothetical protein
MSNDVVMVPFSLEPQEEMSDRVADAQALASHRDDFRQLNVWIGRQNRTAIWYPARRLRLAQPNRKRV